MSKLTKFSTDPKRGEAHQLNHCRAHEVAATQDPPARRRTGLFTRSSLTPNFSKLLSRPGTSSPSTQDLQRAVGKTNILLVASLSSQHVMGMTDPKITLEHGIKASRLRRGCVRRGRSSICLIRAIENTARVTRLSHWKRSAREASSTFPRASSKVSMTPTASTTSPLSSSFRSFKSTAASPSRRASSQPLRRKPANHPS